MISYVRTYESTKGVSWMVLSAAAVPLTGMSATDSSSPISVPGAPPSSDAGGAGGGGCSSSNCRAMRSATGR